MLRRLATHLPAWVGLQFLDRFQRGGTAHLLARFPVRVYRQLARYALDYPKSLIPALRRVVEMNDFEAGVSRKRAPR